MAVNDTITIAATGLGDTGRLKPEVREALEDPDPDRTRFTRLTKRMGTVKVRRTSFEVQEQWDMQRWVTVGGTTDTTSPIPINSTDALLFVDQQVWEVVSQAGDPTGEHVQLTATPASDATTVAVTRGYGSTTAATITANSTLRRVGTFLTEDDTITDSRQRATNRQTQYITMLQKALSITEVMQKSQVYGVPEQKRLNIQGLRDFARDRENLLKFGPENTGSGTAPNQTWGSKGLYHHAKQWNHFAANGNLSWKAFVNGMQQVNAKGGAADKFIFLSNRLHAELSLWPVHFDIARTDAMSDKFGFEVNTLKIPGLAGNAVVVVDADMDSRNEILVVDFRGLRIAEFKPFDIDTGPAGVGLQTLGANRYTWKLEHWLGLMVTRPWAQGVFTGVDRIVA